MTITNNYLIEVAKAMSGGSYEYSQYAAVGTGAVSAIATTATALAGEIGTRDSFTSSRTTNQVTFNAVPSSVSVLDTTNGDVLSNVGAFASSTGGNLHFGSPVSGVTQTTAFDLEIDFTITYDRK